MDLEMLKDNFRQLGKQIAAARKEMQNKSTGFIEAACSQFFEQCPEVEKISWTQYAPYFNDGEACEFSVNELVYTLVGDEDADDEGSIVYTEADLVYAKEKLEDAIIYTANPTAWSIKYVEDYKVKHGREPYYNRNGHRPYPSDPADAQEKLEVVQDFIAKYPAEVINRIESSFAELQGMFRMIDDDIMEAVYGNHVRVTITRHGTEIDEYDHD